MISSISNKTTLLLPVRKRGGAGVVFIVINKTKESAENPEQSRHFFLKSKFYSL